MMKHFYTMETPIGLLAVAEADGAVTHITLWDEKAAKDFAAEGMIREETPTLAEAIRQLEEYFAETRTSFDLPLAPKGTPFQKKVWQALTEIPYGSAVTYKDIAVKVGCPKGPRAVGMANNRNPIMIVIPCHRVIGSDGSLVGYEGGVHIKEALLKLEKTL